MYRPQFPYVQPAAPCVDQRCQYSFDSTNTPALLDNLDTLTALSRIPLILDTDAPFFLRGITISKTDLMVRLEDCNSNPLSDQDNLTAIANYEYPDLYGNTDGAGLVALDSDMWGAFMPAGGAVLLYVYNPTSGSVSMADLVINLHGVKRFQGGGCS